MLLIGDSVHLAFGEHQLAIHGNVPEALAFVRRTYARMMAGAAHASSRIDITLENDAFQLDAHRTFTFPAHDIRSLQQELKRQITIGFMEARPDLVWIHAAAVAWGRQTVLLCGPGGCGKSTLTAALCARGWTYLSDDVAPIDPATNQVLPFPVTPFMRIRFGNERVGDLDILEKRNVELVEQADCVNDFLVRAIVFPRFGFGETARLETMPVANGVFEMVEQSLNFGHHRQRAISYLTELLRSRPVSRLPFDSPEDATRLLIDAYGAAGSGA